MTHHGATPTRDNRREWTAYERQHSDDTGFDHDARSCRHGTGIWPTYLSDCESLTILTGLDKEEYEE